MELNANWQWIAQEWRGDGKATTYNFRYPPCKLNDQWIADVFLFKIVGYAAIRTNLMVDVDYHIDAEGEHITFNDPPAFNQLFRANYVYDTTMSQSDDTADSPTD